MKKKKLLHLILVTIILLLQQTNSHAQIKDVEWEPWQTMPCYKGLSVSALNMGWGKEPEGYLWGVRIKNDYNTSVTFTFDLIVGNEKLKGGARAAYKLKPGEIWTDGGNVFTANLYKTSSVVWKVEIDDVCFDGMRCGGEDNCYAECDAIARKVNQPCGLEAHTSIVSGYYEDIYDQFKTGDEKVKIEETDEGVNLAVYGIPLKFKKISETEYEWFIDRKFRLKIKNNKELDLTYNANPSGVFRYVSNSPPILSEKETYNVFTNRNLEGEWINDYSKKKMNMKATPAGYDVKKEGQALVHFYFTPERDLICYNEGGGKSFITPFNINELQYSREAKDLNYYERLNPIEKPVKNTVIEKKENKIEPPIVKQETKPAPVTENKTASNNGSVSGKWYIAQAGLMFGDYSITIEDLGDKLKMTFMLEPDPWGGEGRVNMSGTILTAKKSAPYNGRLQWMFGAPVWEGIYPLNGMIPCEWIYIGTVGKEQLVMKEKDDYVRKFYRIRHSQGF